MKRWLVPALVLMLAVAPADSVAGKKKKKPKVQQVVEGTIDFMAPDPSSGTCVSGATRRPVLLGVSQAQGVFGYHFDVDQATWNGKFVLEVDGDQDLDLIFYTDFGDQTAAGKTVGYESRESGGEAGTIPANMTKAIVCMYSGSNATFKYTGTGK